MTVYLYVRVSREDCDVDNQIGEMGGCGLRWDEVVCDEGVSGAVRALNRPGWAGMASRLKKGDKVLVTKIDRLGRSASDVLATCEALAGAGVGLVVKQFDCVDLTSSVGKLLLTMLAATAEFERNLISERTIAGLAKAKANGKVLGKPAPVGTREHVMELLRNGVSVTDAARIAGVSRQSIYQWKNAQ